MVLYRIVLYLFTCTNRSISAKSIIAKTVKGTMGILASCIHVAWVEVGSTLVNIYNKNKLYFKCNIICHRIVTSCNTCLPVQIVPFPLNLSLQKQLKEPLVFWQVAFMWHELKSATHSSISIKIISNVINANIIWHGIESYRIILVYLYKSFHFH